MNQINFGVFGNAAVEAAKMINMGAEPLEAWERGVRLFSDKEFMVKKGCPKTAFLCLCDQGLVRGCPSNPPAISRDNGRYAMEAVQVLRQAPSANLKPIELWNRISVGATKKHNSQMNIVLALHSAGLLQRSNGA